MAKKPETGKDPEKGEVVEAEIKKLTPKGSGDRPVKLGSGSDRPIGSRGSGSDRPPTQAGMDRRIEKSKYERMKKPGMYAAGVLALIAAYMAFAPEGGRTLKVDNDRIVVSRVTTGQFDDFIPVRGRVTPLKTIFLDAVDGGQVESIHVEDGAFVEAGQLLVVLANTSLQLDVISREAQVTEQLNNLRSLELAQEQNRLAHKRELVEIDYQLVRLNRQIGRQEQLAAQGYVPRSDFEDLKDERDYYQRRRAVRIESQQSDERMQQQQKVQLKAATDMLERNLVFARGNLDKLNFRAPAAGKLTAFDVQVGQSLAQGERLGQIDDPDNFKVEANIDEFYLGRVDIGQTASLETSGQRYELRIAKVYPQVSNGQFKIDLVFEGDRPDNVRRGQTLQTRLQLGDPSEAILIPNGAFYQDTGGNWIFVVSSDGSQAVKRSVRLGRRNLRYIEVLDGLEPGEEVVTSPYTNYIDMDRLELRS